MAHKLQSIDRRIIYLILVVVLALPFIFPIKLPIEVSKPTQDAYKTIDQLKDGDVVVMCLVYTPNTSAEAHPMSEALLTHILSKNGVKIIMATFTETGPIFSQQLWDKFGKNLKYGEDFVDLGFAPGGETAVSGFANDIHKVFPVDVRGTPVGQLPLMQKVKSAKDITLLVGSETGNPGTPEFIRQIQGQHKTPIVAGWSGQYVPVYAPYYNAGQVKGFLNGLRGAAEYEILLGKPGEGIGGLGSVTAAMTMVAILILIANITYQIDKKGKAQAKEANQV
jgi:hypothetical protein